MAAYDNVSLPGPPQAPSYTAPLLNFAPIGDLAKDYFQGTQMARQRALQTAFSDGLPRLQDGSLNIQQITDTLAKLGGADAALGAIKLQQQQQFLNQPNPYDAAVGGGALPARTPIPAHGIPEASPTTTAPTVPASNEATNPKTLANIVQSQIADPTIAGRVITAAARRLGIDPGAEIDPNNPTVAAYVRSANGGVVPTGGQAGGPAPVQVAQAAPLPEGVSEQAAQNLDRAAAFYRNRGRGEEMAFGQGTGKADLDQANDLTAKAKQMRDLINDNAKATPEIKNAAASGLGSPAELKQREEQQKVAAVRFDKQAQGITAAASAADSMIPHLQLAKSYLSNPKFYSGPLESVNLQYKRILGAIDPAHANDPVPQEAFRKVMAANILDQVAQLKAETAASGGSTRIFQSQIALMEKAAQNPNNSIAANRLLTEIGFRAAHHAQEIADMADRYNGGVLDAKFNTMLRKYNAEHPLFTKEELEDPRLIAPPEFGSFKDAFNAKLPSGTPVKVNGNIQYVK